MQGAQLNGQEEFLQTGEPQAQEPIQAYEALSFQKPVAHTRFLFLKTILPLWIISHLIAVMSGYMLFSFLLYGWVSAVLHSLIAAGAAVLVYGMFMQQNWARWYGIGYSGFVVANSWANIIINYIRYYDIIVFTDIITDVLLMFIFMIIGITMYRNNEYFSGRGNVMFEKDSSNARRAAHIATCAILAFGLAVYFYFVWIRL